MAVSGSLTGSYGGGGEGDLGERNSRGVLDVVGIGESVGVGVGDSAKYVREGVLLLFFGAFLPPKKISSTKANPTWFLLSFAVYK